MKTSDYPGMRRARGTSVLRVIPGIVRRLRITHSSLSLFVVTRQYRARRTYICIDARQEVIDGSTVTFDTKARRRLRAFRPVETTRCDRAILRRSGVIPGIFPRRLRRRKGSAPSSSSSPSPSLSGAHSPYAVARWQPFLISLDNSLSGA